MMDFKEPEVLFHTAALGHTGALGTELDYGDKDGGLGHGVWIQMLTGDLIHYSSSNSWKLWQIITQANL